MGRGGDGKRHAWEVVRVLEQQLLGISFSGEGFLVEALARI